ERSFSEPQTSEIAFRQLRVPLHGAAIPLVDTVPSHVTLLRHVLSGTHGTDGLPRTPWSRSLRAALHGPVRGRREGEQHGKDSAGHRSPLRRLRVRHPPHPAPGGPPCLERTMTMPHATPAYPFEGKVFQFAWALSATLA